MFLQLLDLKKMKINGIVFSLCKWMYVYVDVFEHVDVCEVHDAYMYFVCACGYLCVMYVRLVYVRLVYVERIY